jgi:hypothetical protein
LSVSKRRAFVSSTECCRLQILSTSINPSFRVALLLRGYSTSASVRRPLSFMSLRPTESALPVCLCWTFRGSASRPSLKVQWLHLILFRTGILLAVMVPCLHFKPLDLLSRVLTFVFVRAQEDFLHGSLCTLRDFIAVTSSLCFDVTSFLPLRLHIDRGLVRHGYPWVSTDQGLRGPCRVGLPCQKLSRPASGPEDLIHSSGDLGRPRTTLSRSRATCQACEASLSIDHGGASASRSEDHGIFSVITEGELPKFVTDHNEGPPTSNGNPSAPAV